MRFLYLVVLFLGDSRAIRAASPSRSRHEIGCYWKVSKQRIVSNNTRTRFMNLCSSRI